MHPYATFRVQNQRRYHCRQPSDVSYLVLLFLCSRVLSDMAWRTAQDGDDDDEEKKSDSKCYSPISFLSLSLILMCHVVVD